MVEQGWLINIKTAVHRYSSTKTAGKAKTINNWGQRAINNNKVKSSQPLI
ncbi:MAG: hypothetical protein OHM56_08015 [Spiroplasma phoeniceum]|nr:MAG: hypothetical protein OHM57_07415 [Spiroplasma phoeniceum]UZQ31573.1 MAG: hypothetical protein OHM56_08015 [Spiroplasma phoeniceum]